MMVLTKVAHQPAHDCQKGQEAFNVHSSVCAGAKARCRNMTIEGTPSNG